MKARRILAASILAAILMVTVVGGTVFGAEVAGKVDSADAYRVGINDVIDIRVIDHPDLRTVAPVASDGTITFPYLGSVYVKGLSLSEIREEITKRLAEGYVKYPVVTVLLAKSMSRKIYTYGQLNKRGEIMYEEDITLLKALSLAGGVTPEGLFGKVIIRRREGDSHRYRKVLETYLDNGMLRSRKIEDTLLEPDDILIVQRNKTILIQGEVVKRGRFPLERGMTVLKALLQAGGANDNGKYGKIKLRRKWRGKKGGYREVVEARLNEGVIQSSKVEETLLRADDILIVERNRTFLVEGEVMKRGRFPLEEGMTVLRALLSVGGVKDSGRYGRIRVRRKEEGSTGGYRDLVEAKLNEGAIESRKVEDTVLEPDDILIVEGNKKFYIYGEVNKKGEFDLKKDMTVFRAITIAGGFTKWGSESRVNILRAKSQGGGFEKIRVDIGKVIKGDATADIRLQPGDTIIVSTGIF